MNKLTCNFIIFCYTATLPEVFFPSVIARERNSGKLVVGEDAFKPNIRHKSIIQKPVRPTTKGDKV